ncbi:uncharacterized protein M6B38_166010 [Iris pallida]|uniref:Uncharacterized protein n=1 Tax=Iris pallida TaxID=29817 RepID=A0AAX6EXG3_IRIPA|nr:uncharacterized protein M6B38_166010 [Iris pallida]
MCQVYDEVNSSGYDHHTEACCFLLKSNGEHPENGWEEEDGERAIFAGKLDVGMGSAGFFDEDVTSCEVDRLAEGAWNCYFGRNSTWHYMGSV